MSNPPFYHCDPDEIGISNSFHTPSVILFSENRAGMKNPLCPLPLWWRFFAALLLTCWGASVPRYDSAFHLGLFDVRAKHFRQDAANLKNLSLCNQKHRLFLYLLGKCFAPTNVGRITREPDAAPVPSSQFLIPN